MNLNLKDKIAFITGGSKGIGFGIAHSLVAEGVSVILLARSIKDLDQAKAEFIGAGGSVLMLIQADLSDPKFEEIIKKKTIDNELYPNQIVDDLIFQELILKYQYFH